MGQSQSFDEPVASLGNMQAILRQQALAIKRAATITYEQFEASIVDLNKVTQSFTDRRGKQLRFLIKRGTEDNLLWKGTIRIKCQKVNTHSDMVESCRLLSLRQYVILYNEITDQVRAADIQRLQQHSGKRSNSLTASIIFNGVDDITGDDDEECIICMENKSKVILPCAHRFCEGCIDKWNVSHNTCPICRSIVASSDETWVLTEKLDTQEYESEVKGYLVGLADRR